MDKQQLASKIWQAANKMRSKIEANEYKDYILGFLFYKFLSDKEVEYLKENDWTDEDIKTLTEEDEDTVENVKDNLGYFIAYDNLFSTWIDKGHDFNIGDVTTALNAFSSRNIKQQKVFGGIFKTLQEGISKLGATTKEQTSSALDIIELINDVPTDDKQGYDVLGFVYEYLIYNFAANAGKKAGEFYTPYEVSTLMAEIIAYHHKDKDKIEIYDSCSGSGSLLITIGKAVSKHMKNKDGVKYYAQELKENTYNLTRMNLTMRGIKADNIVARCGDTLKDDWPFFEEVDGTKRVDTYQRMRVDAVTTNPPYSATWDRPKQADERFSDYGLAPKGKADYAFLLHDLYHVKTDGIMTIVLPHGVLFRGGDEKQIRTKLIEKNQIDTIIGLPANIFFGTGIPTIVMVLKPVRDKKTDDVLIIDASKGFIKEGKNNKLRACDIKKIVDAYKNRKDIDKFCRVVSRQEIRDNDYNLNIPRYVDSSEKAESWDIYSTMFGGVPNKEIDDLNDVWKAFPSLKGELFKSLNDSYSEMKVKDVKQTILNNKDVKNFISKYSKSFEGFDELLNKELITNVKKADVNSLEEKISDEIFNRLDKLPLVNPYEAYQYLDDEYKTISNDIEIIQTEGQEAYNKVDEIYKKKKNDKTGKEEDKFAGYEGHILPFAVVQSTYFKSSLESITDKENKVASIEGQMEEVIENLNEDEREAYYFDTEKNAFISKEFTKALKDKNLEEETQEKLNSYDKLDKEKKALNKEIKADKKKLEDDTIEKIHSVSVSEIDCLLDSKWIKPLLSNINAIPNKIINDLTSKLDYLSKKYAVTYSELDENISKTEKELSSMLNELEGNEYDNKGIKELKSLLGGK